MDPFLAATDTFSSEYALVRYAFLALVNETNYEQAKTSASTSGNVQITELFKIGDAEATYEQFNEKRREFFQLNSLSMSDERAVHIAQWHVPSEARGQFVECMAGRPIAVYFANETAGSADLFVKYNSAPGSSIAVQLNVVGGTLVNVNPPSSQWQGTLQGQAEQGFQVHRATLLSDIRALANGAGASASGVSVSQEMIRRSRDEVDDDRRPIANLTARAVLRPEIYASAYSNPEAVRDGNWDTFWRYDGHGPVWFDLEYQQPITLARVLFTFDQYPPGNHHYMVLAKLTDETEVLVREFRQHTQGGMILDATPATRIRNVKRVRVQALSGPAWIAYKEIQVWGVA